MLNFALPSGYTRDPETPEEIQNEDGVTINLPLLKEDATLQETVAHVNDYFDYLSVRLDQIRKRVKKLEDKK
jgi:hypothetical protein